MLKHSLIFKITLIFCLSGITITATYAQILFGKNSAFSNKWHQGHIVLHNGDTLNGLLKYESSVKALADIESKMNKVFFKKTQDAKKKKYNKEEFVSFTVKKSNNSTDKYATVYTSKKRIQLLKVITEGKVSLYEVTFYSGSGFAHQYDPYSGSVDYNSVNTSSFSYENMYIKRENEKIASNEFFANAFKNFNKTAKAYFSDCPELVKKINDDDFKKRTLVDIVEFYNENCN